MIHPYPKIEVLLHFLPVFPPIFILILRDHLHTGLLPKWLEWPGPGKAENRSRKHPLSLPQDKGAQYLAFLWLLY